MLRNEREGKRACFRLVTVFVLNRRTGCAVFQTDIRAFFIGGDKSGRKHDVAEKLAVVNHPRQPGALRVHDFRTAPAARTAADVVPLPVVEEGYLSVTAELASHALENLRAVRFLSGLKCAERKFARNKRSIRAVDVCARLHTLEFRIRRLQIPEVVKLAAIFFAHIPIGVDDAQPLLEIQNVPVQRVGIGKTHLKLLVHAVIHRSERKKMAEETSVPKMFHDAFAQSGGLLFMPRGEGVVAENAVKFRHQELGVIKPGVVAMENAHRIIGEDFAFMG